MPTLSQLPLGSSASAEPQREKVIVWELEMSFKKWKTEHGAGEFAAFLKAEHVKDFPATFNLLRVDEQDLPRTGPSLVARIGLDAKAKGQLTKDYIDSLARVEARDIGFPLNATNANRLAEIFGDNMKEWHGPITFKTTSVTNPKTKEEVDSLRVQVPKK
jgi:hypothetical protein